MLVIGRGRVLIIEIDGPHHRSSRRYVDDRNRDLQWQRCGVQLYGWPSKTFTTRLPPASTRKSSVTCAATASAEPSGCTDPHASDRKRGTC